MKEDLTRQNALYLLFWPFFGLRYFLIEQYNPAKAYHPVNCSLDSRIPFLEVFVIPYVLWYACIIGVHIWLYMQNNPVYTSYSHYLMVTMVISSAVFLLYPTCQNLRPAVFPRDNLLTDAVKYLYRTDTNTNVCPSEHVIASAGFFLAVIYSDAVKIKWKIRTGITALMTASATVFLKQHSVMDIVAAFPVCLVGWYSAFFKTRFAGI